MSLQSRRVFFRELNQILPQALDEMTKGTGNDRSPVAPVDLSQAIIGPGMVVFRSMTRCWLGTTPTRPTQRLRRQRDEGVPWTEAQESEFHEAQKTQKKLYGAAWGRHIAAHAESLGGVTRRPRRRR